MLVLQQHVMSPLQREEYYVDTRIKKNWKKTRSEKLNHVVQLENVSPEVNDKL